ncbi:hypothetical protein I4U23_011439 [Adineta vaga]|nr:hypothetical protein I4U23_011439 [Adineta vaga]
MAEIKFVSKATQTASADLQDECWIQQMPSHQRSNLEGHQLVWCDNNEVIQDTENIITLAKLRSIVDYTKLFDDVSSCRRYIEQTCSTTTFLVCVGNMAFSLIPQVHELNNIKSIYIHRKRKSSDLSQTLANFSKVKSEHITAQSVLNVLTDDVNTYCKEEKKRIFNQNDENESSSLDDYRYCWWPQFINMLCKLPYHLLETDDARQKLISHVRQYYRDNESEQKLLDDFQETYTPENAIWWYTRDTFFYRLLNKALRQHNIEDVTLFGFYLKDLYNQLKPLHKSFLSAHSNEQVIKFYRGQLISLKDIKKIQAANYYSITISSLFSTSIDRNVALFELNPSEDHKEPGLEYVLFEIEVDTGKRSLPFGNITHLSNFPSEQEILLMVGTHLKVVKVVYEEERKFYLIELTLADNLSSEEDNEKTNSSLSDLLKNCIYKTMNGLEKANITEINCIFDKLSGIFLTEKNWLEGSRYHCLGNHYKFHRESYRTALPYYEQAINVYQIFLTDSELELRLLIANCYRYIGDIYKNNIKDKMLARKHYDLSISMLESLLATIESSNQRVKAYEIIIITCIEKGKVLENDVEKQENSQKIITCKKAQVQEMVKANNNMPVPISSLVTSERVFYVIWLDSALSTSPELIETRKKLKELFDEQVLAYDKANECNVSIQNKIHDKIIFVIEIQIARSVVYLLHDLPQIYRILIYSTNEEVNEQWMTYYSKIRVMVFTPDLLIENVLELMDENVKQDREEEQRKRFGASSQPILWLKDLRNTPLVSLEDAVEPLRSTFPRVNMSARVAKYRIGKPPDGLTIDESAAIQIYETGGSGLNQRIYDILNRVLFDQDRDQMQPYLSYLKLLLTALWKLPSFQGTICYEEQADVSNQYRKGQKGIWWQITATRIDSRKLRKTTLFGLSKQKTMFSIQCENGKPVKKHLYVPYDEILLLPGFQYEVLGVQQHPIEKNTLEELKLAPFESKSWPDLVGKPVDEAIEEIKRENPDYQVEKLALHSPMKLNLRPTRVRVFFDELNKVARPPQTG